MPEYTIAVTLALMLAGFGQGYFGFGFGIIGTTLLALLGPSMIGMTAVVTIAALFTIMLLLRLSQSHSRVDWPKSIRLVVGAAMGQPLGYLFIHTFGNRPVFRVALGAFLVLFALNGLFTPHVRKSLPRYVAVLAGILGGFLGGAFVTGGPPIVLYLFAHVDDPREMKATVQFVFSAGVIYRLISIGVAGDYTAEVLKLASVAVPVAMVALVVGHALSHKAPADRFRRHVYAVIGCFGLCVLGKGALGWLS